jgi:glycosyltransferase involved in cell wall biosynthesis
MKLAITISTYQRKDGRTKHFLTRALKSIKNQTHKDYKVFLIGDRYENNDEFESICSSIIEPEKIYFENLKIAKERDKYIGENNLDKIWCSGGVNATNYGIEKALNEGYDYICHLDHDDYWANHHLSSISELIENHLNSDYPFIATYCGYLGIQSVPIHSSPGKYYPVPGDLVHSSTCVNFRKIDLRYRDVFEETGITRPADADLLERISKYLKENNKTGFLIGEKTVFLDKRERE